MVKVSRAIFLMLICLVFLSIPNISLGAEDLIVKLVAPDVTGGKPLMQALSERKSSRSFKEDKLSDQIISNLLWSAFGINRPDSGKRTAPSAMNMQEIDIYVAKEDGLFIYLPKEHALKQVLPKDIREFVGTQEFTQIAPLGLIYVADLSKMSGEEDSKVIYSSIDTGFISQNAYLYCASEGLSTVVLGWVDKDKLSKEMNLGDDKRITFTQPVGYSK